MLITLGPRREITVGTLHDVTFPQLVEWLRNHPRGLSPVAHEYAALAAAPAASDEGRRLAAAKDGPWVAFAAFDGNHRHLSKSPRGYAIPLDLDHTGFTPDTIAATLYGYNWCLLTTFGHTTAAPRWRVIVPVDGVTDIATHRATWAALNSLFANSADPAAKDITRLNYLPGLCVAPDQASVWAVTDAANFPVVPAPPETASTPHGDGEGPVEGWCGPLDDDELLRRSFSVRTRPEERFSGKSLLQALFEPDAHVLSLRYPAKESNQEWENHRATTALVGELMYFTGNDRERVVQLALRAGCMQAISKEHERKVRAALSQCEDKAEVYNWSPSRPRLDVAKPPSAAELSGTEGDAAPVPAGTLAVIGDELATAIGSMPLSYKPNGQYAPTLTNITTVLSHPSANRLAYDTFRGETMIASAAEEDWRPVDDVIITRLMMEFERLNFASITVDYMRRALDEVAARQQFDSAIRWLESLPPWDGVERIATFFPELAGSDDSEYARAVGAYLWTALAGRVLVPGVKADMVPVMIGSQGLKKTWGIEAFVPHPDHFVEVSLTDRDTDMARMMRGKLVGEIGELRGLGKRDLESVKSFITRTNEQWIPKYKEFAVTYPRRLVFIGTTNQHQFLEDDTGNRRWLPIVVRKLERDRIIAVRDQLWAEGAARFRASGVAWQDAEQLAAAQHEQHMVTDSWESAIERWLTEVPTNLKPGEPPPPPPCQRPFHISEVLRNALHISIDRMNRAAEMRAGRILRQLGYGVTRIMENYKRANRWVKL